MAVSRNFIWESPYFNNINESTLKFAKRLLDDNYIVDVFMDDNGERQTVCIQHTIAEGCDFQKEAINKSRGIESPRRQFMLPFNLKVENSTGCQDKERFNCTYFGCPIIIAGYLFHNERNLKNTVVRDLCNPKKNELDFKGQTDKELIEEILSDTEFKDKYSDALKVIDNDYTLPDEIKNYFIKTLKVTDNFKSISERYIQDRPNYNVVFIENTDTSNKICVGQRKAIEDYMKILKISGVLDVSDDELMNDIKYVDFKNLTKNEALTEENYKQDVIVLHNIFYMTGGVSNGGSSEIVLNETLIRTGFPEFILQEGKKKIFIICDKAANVRLMFSKLQQLSFVFTQLKIPDLKVPQIYDYCMKRFNDETNGVTYNKEFEANFEAYLNENYIYSPYKNLEFVEFLFDDAIKKTLYTNHPNEIHMDNLIAFRNQNNAGSRNLKALIGLDNVKNEINNLQTFLKYAKEKEKLGDKMPKIDLHMCFLGNPGTGKTTVARFMADILFNLEYIRYNKCIECEAKDLIANVPGQTAMKTAEKVQEALGGVLFVDEAYAISESKEYGYECVAALIKSMEDYRDDLVVILAGYKQEMSRFLEMNSGFKSRIAFYFMFEDYSNEELYQMFEKLAADYGYEIHDPNVRNKIFQILDQEKKMGSGFGNSRYMRNLIDIALRNHAINYVQESDVIKRYHILTPEDIKRKQSAN